MHEMRERAVHAKIRKVLECRQAVTICRRLRVRSRGTMRTPGRHNKRALVDERINKPPLHLIGPDVVPELHNMGCSTLSAIDINAASTGAVNRSASLWRPVPGVAGASAHVADLGVDVRRQSSSVRLV